MLRQALAVALTELGKMRSFVKVMSTKQLVLVIHRELKCWVRFKRFGLSKRGIEAGSTIGSAALKLVPWAGAKIFIAIMIRFSKDNEPANWALTLDL